MELFESISKQIYKNNVIMGMNFAYQSSDDKSAARIRGRGRGSDRAGNARREERLAEAGN